MPSTIPYDPSLILGNIVHPSRLVNIEKIAALQAPVDAAEADMNSLISLKRSIDMTIQEMLDMHINVSELVVEAAAVGELIKKAALDYGIKKIASEKAIQPLRSRIVQVHGEIESPIDYNKSAIKKMDLGSDSLQMNVQYFSCEQNQQSSYSHAANISSFISNSLSYFGVHHAHQASVSAQQQVHMQMSNHSIAGTLVISISCTHKDARIFAPFILDVDKAVRAWNQLHPMDMIKTNDPASIMQAASAQETLADRAMYLLSGCTYGSSFVGMVHILNTSHTVSSEHMETVASQMQEKLNLGAWFAKNTGEFGVSSSFSDDVKNLLSTQSLQSHCSLVTMGIIPTIKSNIVKTSVMQFVDSEGASPLDQLAKLQGATAEENNTIASGARQAMTGKQMVELRNASINAAITGLSKMEEQENSIININSMMTAMDDYIQKCIEADNSVGVPINYFIKPITKSVITRTWLQRYYPGMMNGAGRADDSEVKKDNSEQGGEENTEPTE